MSIAKKIFIISSVLLATVLFFMGIYNISFKEKNSISEPAKEDLGIGGKNALEKLGEKIGIKKNEKIYQLSNEAVIAPAIADEGEKIVYYTRLTGNVYKVNLNGEREELLDDNNFSGLDNVLWSPDRSKVISRFNNSGRIEQFYYDYNEKKATKLSSGISEIIWNNLGDGIIYEYVDVKTGKKTLNAANSDGSNWKKITDISGDNSSLAAVPQSSFVSFWNSPKSLEETSLYLVGITGGAPKKIFSGRFGADYLWSSNGTKVLISSSDSKGGSKISLAIINNNGGEYQNLNIPTFVSKCVWSKDGKTIFYALPNISPSGYILPDDYQNKKIISQDTFWKMDILSGKAERIAEMEEIKDSYDATNLFLSPSEDILFFTDRENGKLYGINL